MPKPIRCQSPTGRSARRTEMPLKAGADATIISSDCAPSGETAASRLLGLPVELIVMIIERAVVTSARDKRSRIAIDTAAASPPPLLQTCRALRQIGLPVFWMNNYYVADIFDFDARLLMAWMALKPATLRHENANLSIGAKPATNPISARINLMAWLKTYSMVNTGPYIVCTAPSFDHPTRCRPFQSERVNNRVWKIFDLARDLHKMGLQWKDAKRMLSRAIDIARVLGEP